MTPKAWVDLFKSGILHAKAIPEKKILEGFLYSNELDLTKQYSRDILDNSNAITIVATSDETLYQKYEKIRSDFLSRKDNLIINPIYKIEERGNTLVLKRPSNIDGFGDYLSFSEKYLPERYEISRKLFNKRQVVTSDTKIVENLMKRFIVVNVPQNYI
jgi:hypothetical protein